MLRIAPLNLDLSSAPDDARHFSREVEIVVEATDEHRLYAASFVVEICSPSWLAERADHAGWTWGRRRLIVPQWAPATVERAIASLLAPAERLGWTGLMRELEQYWQGEEPPDELNAPAS